jgi:hypothetical protein
MIRRTLCEIIQRKLAGGEPSSDFEPSLVEINALLDSAIAYAAKSQYNETAQIDVEYIADSFYTTFRDISMVEDIDTGHWSADIPAAPAGLPRGYDMDVFPYGTGSTGRAWARISPQQLAIYTGLPKPVNTVLFWTEGSKLKADSPFDLSGIKVMIRMVVGSGSQELTAELACDGTYIPGVLEWMDRHYSRPPKDNSTDGLNVK